MDTLNEIKDSLSEGVWYSGAARWTAYQCRCGFTVQARSASELVAYRTHEPGHLLIERPEQFDDKASLEFIRIFNKYSHLV